MTGEAGSTGVRTWAWLIVALLVAALSAGLFTLIRPTGQPVQASSPSALSVDWTDGTGSISAHGVAQGTAQVVGLASPQDLVVSLANATFAAIPRTCLPSTAKVRMSWVSSDLRELHCIIPPDAAVSQVEFTAVVDGEPDGFVSGTAGISDLTARLADRPVTVGVKPESRSLRLLSGPDFTNADIAHLGPGAGAQATNSHYERSLDTILSDWKSKDPDDVLVAGDLVDGHWGQDTHHLQVFGPVGTDAQRRAAVRRAGQVFYSQWTARLRAHGLDQVHPAMGDHEYGDNPWDPWKLNLFSAYQAEWVKHFGRFPDGRPRYADRPRGSVHEFSAYAWRPSRDVQLITLDEFTREGSRMRLEIDRRQQDWLVGVLQRARADHVPWVIVQGHLPILGPVREGASSGLRYAGGQRSALWRIFKQYGVDVYLCGEVHDVTAIQRDGVLQLSHGGILPFGRLNYLIADVYPGHLDLNVYDYLFKREGNSRLWETRGTIPANISYEPNPDVIGTAQLWRDGQLTRVGGALLPYHP